MCIQEFVSDAVSCQHLDVVYVYRKLVSEKAFLYTAMPNEVHVIKHYIVVFSLIKQTNVYCISKVVSRCLD